MDRRKWMTLGVGAAFVIIIVLLVILLRPESVDTDVVGLCYREKTTEANSAERTALETLLKEKGLQVTVVDADGDQAKQLQQVAELAKKGCDSLIVEPVMVDAASELLKALDATGLPAVLINRELDTTLLTSYSKIAYVGIDSAMPGKLQAQMALALADGGDLNGDGVLSYMILQGPENHIQVTACTQALETALKESPLELQRLTAVYGDWTYESGRTLCSQEIAKFGKDIEVIFCGNGPMVQGAMDAIADGGRTVGKDVYLYGMADAETALFQTREFNEGNLSGTVVADAAVYRTAIVNAVYNQIKGQPVEKVQIIPYIAINGESVSELNKES